MSKKLDFVDVRTFLFNNVENILENLNARKQDKKNESDDLFGGGGGEDSINEVNWVKLNNNNKSKYQILLEEKNSLGLYVSGNPLDEYFSLLDWLRNISYEDNLHLVLIEKIRKIFTKSGGMMLAMQLTIPKQENIEYEQIEGLIFPKNALKYSPVVEEKELFWVRGKISQKKKKDPSDEQEEGEVKEYDELPKLLIDAIVPFNEGVEAVLEKELSMSRKPLVENLDWNKIKLEPSNFEEGKVLNSNKSSSSQVEGQTVRKDLKNAKAEDSDEKKPIILKLKKSLGTTVLKAIKKSEFPGSLAVSIELETADGFKKAKGDFWTTREVINLVTKG